MPSPYLPREEMEAIINNGGSIIYKGAVINDVSKLPDEVELAGDDEEAQKAAVAKVKARAKAAQAEADAAEAKANAKAAAAKPAEKPAEK